MNQATVKKNHKGLKIVLSIFGVLIALLLVLYFVVMTHTQIVVGIIQKLSYPEFQKGLTAEEKPIYATEEQFALSRQAEADIKEWLKSLWD